MDRLFFHVELVDEGHCPTCGSQEPAPMYGVCDQDDEWCTGVAHFDKEGAEEECDTMNNAVDRYRESTEAERGEITESKDDRTKAEWLSAELDRVRQRCDELEHAVDHYKEERNCEAQDFTELWGLINAGPRGVVGRVVSDGADHCVVGVDFVEWNLAPEQGDRVALVNVDKLAQGWGAQDG